MVELVETTTHLADFGGEVGVWRGGRRSATRVVDKFNQRLVRTAGAFGLLAVAACADASPQAVAVVEVAAQPCRRPTRDRGLGFVVADGLVATAAHTVDGVRRELTVDGRPARVVAIDIRLDTAVLAVDLPGEPAELSIDPVEVASVITPDGAQPVRIVATGDLIVDNVTDGTRVQREVHTFSPGVAEGTSGAPLVDGAGRVVGMVQLDRDGADLADAVTAAELRSWLDGVPRAAGRSTGCDPGG